MELVKSKGIYINMYMNSSNNTSFVEKLKKKALPLLLLAFEVPSNNITARYALEFYISGMIPVIGTWLRKNQEITIEELAQVIKGILQEGVLKQILA